MTGPEDEAPSRHLVVRRVRNGIIEYLELASSFDEQRAYQRTAQVSVPVEVINQWEDWVHHAKAAWLGDASFSHDERQAVVDFHSTWADVSARTPDPLPRSRRSGRDARMESPPTRGGERASRSSHVAENSLKTRRLRHRRASDGLS